MFAVVSSISKKQISKICSIVFRDSYPLKRFDALAKRKKIDFFFFRKTVPFIGNMQKYFFKRVGVHSGNYFFSFIFDPSMLGVPLSYFVFSKQFGKKIHISKKKSKGKGSSKAKSNKKLLWVLFLIQLVLENRLGILVFLIRFFLFLILFIHFFIIKVC